MTHIRDLKIGDDVKVEFKDVATIITGIVTRIWTPEQHRAGMWQVELGGGWCFHECDRIVFHKTKQEPTKPCWLCGTQTTNTGTLMCDHCRELDSRIKADPDLAQQILNSHKPARITIAEIIDGLSKLDDGIARNVTIIERHICSKAISLLLRIQYAFKQEGIISHPDGEDDVNFAQGAYSRLNEAINGSV